MATVTEGHAPSSLLVASTLRERSNAIACEAVIKQ